MDFALQNFLLLFQALVKIRDEAIVEHRGLCLKISERYSRLFRRNRKEWKEDFFQEAWLGIVQGVDSLSFDSERGKLSSFLGGCSRNNIRNFIDLNPFRGDYQLSALLQPESVDGSEQNMGFIERESPDPFGRCAWGEEHQRMLASVATVVDLVKGCHKSLRDKLIFTLHYGLTGSWEICPTAEVARMVGLKNRQRADQICNEVWDQICPELGLANRTDADVWLQQEVGRIRAVEDYLAAA